jgi:hypothetical protein
MNASPDKSGLVSFLWNTTSKLACEGYDIKKKSAPPVQAFMYFAGTPCKGSPQVIPIPTIHRSSLLILKIY